MANKIQYGLSSLYYAIATEGSDGSLTYATPKRWAGAVSLSLDNQGDTQNEYADNGIWYALTTNNGYQGTLEMETLSDDVRQDLFNEVLTESGMLVEKSDDKQVQFALLGQFEGDQNAKRFCLFNCVITKPSMTGNTTSDSTEIQHDEMTITAMPRISDKVVKATCSDSSASAYANWFSAVPTVEVTTE